MQPHITIDTSVLTLIGMILGFILQMFQAYRNSQARTAEHKEAIQATGEATAASKSAEAAANHLNSKILVAQNTANATLGIVPIKEDAEP